jgi:polyhydroxybutyrate depolymerase
MTWVRILGACALAIAVAAEVRADLLPGDHALTLSHGGRERSYIVHVPRDRLVNPWPVMLNFHGGGSSAAGQQAYSRMDATADREGFLVVYPNGSGVLASRLLTWNAGRCCGYAMKNAVDDVAFVRTLIEDLASRVDVDRGRVYATGLSNGAMMAYRLAAEAPELVAAIAAVAGASAVLPMYPEVTVPVLHIHSVDDTRALYAGGVGPPYPLTNTRVTHPAVEPMIANWARHDGCAPLPAMAPTIRGRDGSAGHTATRIRYGECRHGVEVVLLRLSGAGHVWPGGAHDYVSRLLGSQSKILGPATDVVDANAEIWRFVSIYGFHPPTSFPE